MITMTDTGYYVTGTLKKNQRLTVTVTALHIDYCVR